MTSSSESGMLAISTESHETSSTPSHHIVAAAPGTGWTSYLPQWNPSQPDVRTRRDGRRVLSRNSTGRSSGTRTVEKAERTGFRNPWPSFHKATQSEVWNALEWGYDNDPCIELATASVSQSAASLESSRSKSFSKSKTKDSAQDRAQQAARLLHVVKPQPETFAFDSTSQRAKVTWLGHAGILVQLPSLIDGRRPIRCVFDPIFSMRCSPSQAAGPMRSYPPPCKVEDLPTIDIVMISHNHYDHLDYDTIMEIWQRNKTYVRFIVPLGNKQWFLDSRIPSDHVTELDWWDSAYLSYPGTQPLKVTCTPSQHNSGRSGFDANVSLWSSWYLEHPLPKPFRVFFAGDTGYQFHDSPHWPPSPPLQGSQVTKKANSGSDDTKFPTCPAFQEIADRLGSPHLLLLPVAVGATYDYLRSYVPLSDSVSPFPRHKPGLTAANHMPPWDAVRVLRLMTSKTDQDAERPPVAIAMHWGTFVTEPVEVLKTLGQLQWACEQHDIRFARSLEAEEACKPLCFLALNHGQSVDI